MNPYEIYRWTKDPQARSPELGRVIQTISRPYKQEAHGLEKFGDWIKVRMVPGDPTTLHELPIDQLKGPAWGQDKKMFLHWATVFGFGYFPIDMLRYDRCQVEDWKLGLDRRFTVEERFRVVQISGDKKPQWHPDRWMSFQWALQPIPVVGMISSNGDLIYA